MNTSVTRSWRGAFTAVTVVLALTAIACGGSDDQDAAPVEADEAAPTTTTLPAGETDTTTGDPSDPTTTGAPAAELAEWQRIEVTDATGEQFAIGDFVGRPVLVENFATWCSNCRRQLGDTQEAAARAGADAVFVALSVETDLDAEDMAEYAADNGFTDIRFAVMTPELLGAMNDAFGNSSLNPPSTPHVSVDAQGNPGDLVTGFSTPDEILASLGLG